MSWLESIVESSESEDIVLHMHYDIYGSYLQVPHLMLAMMDFRPAEFSEYSFIDDKYMYLEEDVDAGKFLRRFEYLNDCMPAITMHDHGEEARQVRELPHNKGISITRH